jgi:regulatory protein
MASHSSTQRRPRPPLDAARLDALALAYVGRFATSRAKLTAYLQRKLRERGWDGAAAPEPAAIAERMARLGYVDDRAFASAKARALTARGYGIRRVGNALHAAGIGEEDSAEAREQAETDAVAAALRFAERRRIGPYAAAEADPAGREKAVAAMLRAGHGFALARAITALPPGTEPDHAVLAELR